MNNVVSISNRLKEVKNLKLRYAEQLVKLANLKKDFKTESSYSFIVELNFDYFLFGFQARGNSCTLELGWLSLTLTKHDVTSLGYDAESTLAKQIQLCSDLADSLIVYEALSNEK